MSALQKKLLIGLALLLVLQAGCNLVRYLLEVRAGAAFGGDFICFWNAAVRARLGDFAAIYPVDDWRRALASPAGPSLAWYVYPPFSLLGLQALGTMSYGEAAAWWSLAPLPFYVALVAAHARRAEVSLQRLEPAEGAGMGWAGLATLAGLTAPWVSANLFSGQTGAWMAVLFLAATFHLPRRPILAGVFIGLIAVKPQLGLLFPFALAASGRWRTVAAAAATIVLLVAASLAWAGEGAWADYAAMTRLFGQFIAVGDGRLAQLALAPYVSLRSAGAPVAVATAVQAAISLAAAGAIVAVFRNARREAPQDGRWDLRLGLLAAGALLSTPYALSYETPLLALAVIPLFVRAWRRGWDGLELAAVVAIVVAPYAQLLLAGRSVPFGLVALLLVFGALGRRYRLAGPGRQEAPGRASLRARPAGL
jgi:hypothetical protein